MGKQNTPLILGFVNNAARNTFNVSQKQVQNKNGQQKAVKQQKPQQQNWTTVNKKANNKGTQSFQSWADVASRNTKNELTQTSWSYVPQQQQRTKNVQSKQQLKQQPKQQQQQQQQQQQRQRKQQKQQQQKRYNKAQQTENWEQDQVITWGWYPASKQEAELKRFRQQKTTQPRANQNKKTQTQTWQKSKQQKMRNSVMMNYKAKKEAQEYRRTQELKKDFNLLKNINNLYDANNHIFPSQTKRNAWISANKVGGTKVLSVATLFAIKYAPKTRGGVKPYIRRNGQIIFNNKCIRHAVEGRFTGHKKFRSNRVLTYIPEKWFVQENTYSCTREKYANINGPKRNERCYSFKGVY